MIDFAYIMILTGPLAEIGLLKNMVLQCVYTYLLSQWTFPKHKRGAISYPLETIFAENNRKTAEDMGI